MRPRAVAEDRYERFNASIGTEAVAKARLRHELTSALRQGEFCLYYQPIYEADGQRMAGVEVLARWLRDGVAVPAGEFVPFAEESGQIISLGRIVLRQLALGTAAMAGPSRPGLLRVRQSVGAGTGRWPLVEELLDSDLTQRPSQLVIEITESLELQENSEAAANLTRLREAGMRIAIDDFGAGFSNFTRLERLHPPCSRSIGAWCAAPAARPKGGGVPDGGDQCRRIAELRRGGRGGGDAGRSPGGHTVGRAVRAGLSVLRARPDRGVPGVVSFVFVSLQGLNPECSHPAASR